MDGVGGVGRRDGSLGLIVDGGGVIQRQGYGEHGVWAGGDHATPPPCIQEQQGISDCRGTAQSTDMGVMVEVGEAAAEFIFEDDKG